MNYFSLLEEFGAKIPVPYIDWPGNILTFSETAVALKLQPVAILTPEESRDMFYAKNLFSEKPKFQLLKASCLIMDSKLWKPCILNPIQTQSGSDCLYQVVTETTRLTYSPSEEKDFRKMVGYDDGIALFGFLKY